MNGFDKSDNLKQYKAYNICSENSDLAYEIKLVTPKVHNNVNINRLFQLM